MATLKDVTLVYVQVQTPKEKYKKPDEYQWEASGVVTKKVATEWKKQFKKQPPKEIPTEEFKDIFKIEPPYPKQEEQYVITVRRDTKMKDKETGEMIPVPEKMKPKVYMNVGTKDSPKLRDVTKKTLVGNGSIGTIQYTVASTKEYGDIAYLSALRVDDLVEYVAASNLSELGEMAEEVEDDNELGSADDSDTDDDDDGVY